MKRHSKISVDAFANKDMGGKNSASALKLESVYSLSKNTIDIIDIAQGVQNDSNYITNSNLLVNPFVILDTTIPSCLKSYLKNHFL